jgi:ubiquinone/menaquinone biosynthesis C-methylase UbiE
MAKPNKNTLYNLALLHIVSKVLTHAVRIKLDKQLTTTPKSILKLARHYKYHPHAMYRFLRVLDAYDVVELFGTTKVKAGMLSGYLDYLRSPHLLDSYSYIDNIEHCLKTNTESFSKTFGKPLYPYLLDHPPELKWFKEWCTKTACDWLPAAFALFDFSKFKCMVDVGGGEGYFLAELLRRNKKQHGVLLDQPSMVTTAKKIFKQYGVVGRAEIVGGDFFKKIPFHGDAYILSRVLLNWSNEDAKRILDNCYRQMPSGATLLIIDFLIPGKKHPTYQHVVASDLNLLACINSAIRTKEEWIKLVKNTGFKFKRYYVDNNPKHTSLISPIFVLEAIIG